MLGWREDGIGYPMRGKCSSKGDIVILLDKPGSIGKENFEILKNFILDFLVHFVIGPNANQISVVSFDEDSKEEFILNHYSSLMKYDLLSRLSNTPRKEQTLEMC
uniref:VWFA domain-containing protein n=1 Tax=Magallana gigas TaxID=29159 RepID=A0A8W8JEB1_MAGGI